MIPDYQSIMLPLLKVVSDKQEHKFRDIVEILAKQFNLSDEDEKKSYPVDNNRYLIIGLPGQGHI